MVEPQRIPGDLDVVAAADILPKACPPPPRAPARGGDTLGDIPSPFRYPAIWSIMIFPLPALRLPVSPFSVVFPIIIIIHTS